MTWFYAGVYRRRLIWPLAAIDLFVTWVTFCFSWVFHTKWLFESWTMQAVNESFLDSLDMRLSVVSCFKKSWWLHQKGSLQIFQLTKFSGWRIFREINSTPWSIVALYQSEERLMQIRCWYRGTLILVLIGETQTVILASWLVFPR